METTAQWYESLLKPAWAPPAWVFGPIWTTLYTVIIVSFGTVFLKVYQKKIPYSVALPFVLNIISNIAFTPIQFGLRSSILASADIIVILGTLVWALIAIYPHLRWVAYVNIPYLVWVCIATALQLNITYLNWGL